MKKTNQLHFGWVVMVGAVLAHVNLGVARYLYPYVLPTMEAELNLTHEAMGNIASAYFFAYTGLTFVSGILTDRFGPRKCLLMGMVITCIGLVGMGFSSSFTIGFLFYLLCGAGAAGLTIPLVPLVSDWFGGKWRGKVFGVVMAGDGVATLGLGFVVPIILSSYSWSWSWWISGIFVLAVAAICWFLLVDTPAERGLTPIGASEEELTASVGQHTEQQSRQTGIMIALRDISKRGTIWNLAGIYFAFGISFVVFTTFAVAYLEEIGWETGSAAAAFAMWGAFGIPGPIICGILADRIAKKYVFALVLALQVIGMLIFLGGSTVGYYVGAAMVGFGVMSTPMVMQSSMADYCESAVVASTFGFVTFAFGIGTIIGPTIGGTLGDATGTLSSAILLALGVAILGFVLALVLKQPSRHQPTDSKEAEKN